MHDWITLHVKFNLTVFFVNFGYSERRENFSALSWFFDIGVIVYPLSTMTLWRNDCLTPIHQIELGLNAINDNHSAMGIYYHMLK